jgi:predicted nucleotidyltransferase
MKLKDELLRIADCLERSRIDYALCGGLAVVVHGYPRMTKDIDILIRPEDLDRAREELAKIEYDLEAGIFRFNPGTSKESVLYRVSRAVDTEWTTLDLMLVAPVFEKVWADREVIQLGTQSLTIVSKQGLITMKEVAGRPQDIADIDALRRMDSQ